MLRQRDGRKYISKYTFNQLRLFRGSPRHSSLWLFLGFTFLSPVPTPQEQGQRLLSVCRLSLIFSTQNRARIVLNKQLLKG